MWAAHFPHIAHLLCSISKCRFDYDPYIHYGPRQGPKTSTYHIDHQLLPTPLESAESDELGYSDTRRATKYSAMTVGR
jgi:hypothetical protein